MDCTLHNERLRQKISVFYVFHNNSPKTDIFCSKYGCLVHSTEDITPMAPALSSCETLFQSEIWSRFVTYSGYYMKKANKFLILNSSWYFQIILVIFFRIVVVFGAQVKYLLRPASQRWYSIPTPYYHTHQGRRDTTSLKTRSNILMYRYLPTAHRGFKIWKRCNWGTHIWYFIKGHPHLGEKRDMLVHKP